MFYSVSKNNIFDILAKINKFMILEKVHVNYIFTINENITVIILISKKM